ncbi:MAG TPA: LytR C-terminal domain-containing protein [Actinomycetota bacterium]|nr:LytR C-terminal domain-containing protein [Actinomycetota bacterium]
MATATLRAALVATALVVGVFVLSRAFPGTEAPVPQSTGAPTTPPEETTPPTEETTPPPEQPSPPVQGVRLAVLNGTTETGLAASTAQKLKKLGYRVDDEDIGDAQAKPYEVTTLFYRNDSRLAARHLRDTVFEGAKLERATDQLDPDIQITVVVGLDWAEKND